LKFTAWFFLAFVVLSGCSHKEIKHVQVPVPSCFSEGDDLGKFCKSQRVLDDSRISITRCIGSANKTAAASLRGKCVEKICAPSSGNDCEIRGEIAVLDEYSQLVRDQAFNDEEPSHKTMMTTSTPAGVSSKKSAKTASAKVKGKKGKGKKQAAATEAVASTTAVVEKEKEWDVDPLAKLPPEPAKPEPVAAAPAPKKAPASEAELAASSTPQPMDVVLKPAKSKKSGKRDPASVQVMDSAFKKVCVAKTDMSAPEILRGKCATRTCNGDNCTYQGRKEMFDYMASR